MLDIDLKARVDDFVLEARLALEEAGVTALFGASGAGKTTLANAVAGLLRPDSGHVRLRGETLFDAAAGIDLPPEDRRVGYVFQDGRLFPHLTVGGNLRYGRRRAQREASGLGFDQVVELLGLEPFLERRPATMSGGERQRVAIGRALLANPRLLLMDEPLAALDARRKSDILPFIERLHSESRVPILYVSHSLDEVLRIADTMALMAAGRVTAVGAVSEIANRIDDPGDPGSVLEAVVAGHDDADGVTDLAVGSGHLRVARLERPVGDRVRVRIRARDVSLALAPPVDISVLNVLEGMVAEVRSVGTATVEVGVDLAIGGRVRAHLTPRSVRALSLGPGAAVHALVKTVAIERYGAGHPS